MTMLHYLRSVVTLVRASGGPRRTRPSLDPPPFGNDHLSYARHVMVKNESDVSAWFNECLDTTLVPRILYLLTLRSSRLRRSHTLCLEKHTHQDMGDSHANRVQCESFSRSLCVLSRRVPLAGANLRNLWVSARKHHDMMMLPSTAPGAPYSMLRRCNCDSCIPLGLVYLSPAFY